VPGAGFRSDPRKNETLEADMPELDNPVLQALRERRSIRRYTDDPVTSEEMAAVLDAGRWAPSGLNNQPWRFLVLWDTDPRVQDLAGLTKYSHVVKRAKALAAVLLHKDSMYHQIKDHQSGGAAVQNMLVAAHSLGLGGVWLGEILNQEPEVLQALGLDPEAWELVAVVAMGRPEPGGSSTRKPLEELMIEEL
jgi:nitroreductase